MKDKKDIKKYKEQLLTIIQYILVFIILISIYIGTLIMSGLIPQKTLEKNVIKSSEILHNEGEKESENKRIDLGYKKEHIFLFTEALMINTAYSVDSNSPLESSMLARKNYIPGQTTKVYIDSQYHLGATKKYKDKNGGIFQVGELYGLMHGEDITESFEYARYWHGYLTILRPLLAITSYQGIRIIILILTILLIGTLLYLISKKINIASAIMVFIGLLAANIFVTTQSMNEITDFLIAIIAGIYILIKKDVNKNIGINFFVIGSITNFFDLLTNPVVTLGLPLIIYFLRIKKERENLKKDLQDFIKICILWSLGYGFTWIAKWIITAILYDRPIISQAIEQITFRSGLKNSRFGYKDIIRVNLKELSDNTILIILIMSFIYILSNLIMKYKKNINFKQNACSIIPYILIAILPFAWFLAVQQHSYIHNFFVHRIFIITIICIFIIINKIFKE